MKLKVIVDEATSMMKLVDAETGEEVENIKAAQYRYADPILNVGLLMDIEWLEVISKNGNKVK